MYHGIPILGIPILLLGWFIEVAVAAHRWSLQPEFRGTFEITIVAMLLANALVSIDDGPYPWPFFALFLAAILTLPRWIAHTAWMHRRRSKSELEAVSILEFPPSWW